MNVRVRNILLLAIADVSLGLSAIFVRYALTGTGALNAAFLRMLIAAPVAVAMAYYGRCNLRFSAAARNRLILAGMILGLHFALWIYSLQYTSVVVATLLVCTVPFWLALYDALARRRFLPPATNLAFLVAAGALYVVVTCGPRATSNGSNPLLGAMLALAAAIVICFYLVMMRSAREGHSTLALIAYAYPGTLLFLGPCALFAHEPLPTTWLSWGGIFGMAVIAQLIGHTLLAASLRNFSSTTVAFAGLLEPPVSAIGAAILLAEPVPGAVVIGGLVLLGAIAVVLAEDRTSASEELAVLESPSL